MRRLVPLLTVSASFVLAACGGGAKDEKSAQSADPETAVRQTLSTFAGAISKHEYATLCTKVFAPKLLQGLQQIGLPCEVAMRNSTGSLQDPRLVVGKVTVDGDTAMAEIRTTATGQKPASSVIQLTRIADAWRVSALSAGPASAPGASPSADEPPEATKTPALTPAPT